jgi:hypothetical protein
MTIEELERLRAEGKRRTAVSLAACSLACRKRGRKERQPRIWTGYFGGRRRAYRGQPVVLPDNSLGFVYGIQRGEAAIWKDSPFVVGEEEHLVLHVSQLRRYKLPSAVLLGGQKRGKKERQSRRKQDACRRNGRRPCGPGKRRGRPRKAVNTGIKPGVAITSERPEDNPPPVGDFGAYVAYYSGHRSGQGRWP